MPPIHPPFGRNPTGLLLDNVPKLILFHSINVFSIIQVNVLVLSLMSLSVEYPIPTVLIMCGCPQTTTRTSTHCGFAHSHSRLDFSSSFRFLCYFSIWILLTMKIGLVDAVVDESLVACDACLMGVDWGLNASPHRKIIVFIFLNKQPHHRLTNVNGHFIFKIRNGWF